MKIFYWSWIPHGSLLSGSYLLSGKVNLCVVCICAWMCACTCVHLCWFFSGAVCHSSLQLYILMLWCQMVPLRGAKADSCPQGHFAAPKSKALSDWCKDHHVWKVELIHGGKSVCEMGKHETMDGSWVDAGRAKEKIKRTECSTMKRKRVTDYLMH